MKLFDVYPLFDIEPVKGLDCFVWDNNGTKYLDLYGGHAVISIGHAHPHYVERMSSQISKLGFYSNSVQNSLQEQLAEKLGEMSGYPDYSLFLCNSGAEANENALKLASFHTGRSKVIAFRKAFHGRTSAAVEATDNQSIIAPINRNNHVTFVDGEDIVMVEQLLQAGDVAAVIIEGIVGIGGIFEPSAGFLQALREMCTKYNVVLILDEIQSGYGRSGKFFAHQYAGIKPDIISVAKGMGNGFPIGGILISPQFPAKYGMLGTTFGGNHLACAAGLAVLEVMEKENLTENAAQVGEKWMKDLATVPGLKEIRGKGLMIGLEFTKPIKALRHSLLFTEKIFTGVSGSNVVRLLPPLTLTHDLAAIFTTAVIKTLEK